jgi:hypothetical protein
MRQVKQNIGIAGVLFAAFFLIGARPTPDTKRAIGRHAPWSNLGAPVHSRRACARYANRHRWTIWDRGYCRTGRKGRYGEENLPS